MHILITGATGFVGKNLITRLVDSNNKVYVLIRKDSDISEIICNGYFVFEDNIESLANYLKEKKIDGIIHLATKFVSEHSCEQIKDLILSNIYLGTSILEAAIGSSTKWFINTGTIWQNFNVPSKSDIYCPVNLYSATKQAFIDISKFYTEISNIKFCTLKLCDTYGENDNRRKIINLFDDLRKNNKSLDMSPGEQIIDLLHINDVVSGYMKLVEMINNNINIKNEYVLSSGKQCTLKELARRYEVKYNCKLNINWGAREYRKREVMTPYYGNILPDWQPISTDF